MIKRAVSILAMGLLLYGCGNIVEDEAEEKDVETLAEVQSVEEETSYFVDNLTTTFDVYPSKVPELTPEEEEIVWEINEYVDEVTSKPNFDDEGNQVYYGDRELVEMVAGDYPEYTADELYNMRNDYYTNSYYNDFGEYYISNSELSALHDEVLEKNLVADNIRFEQGSIDYTKDYSVERSDSSYVLDGQRVNITMALEYNDDYTQATLLRLTVDGEEAIELDQKEVSNN